MFAPLAEYVTHWPRRSGRRRVVENACMLLSSPHAGRICHLNHWPGQAVMSWSVRYGVNSARNVLVPAAYNTRAAGHERALVTAPSSVMSVMFENAEELRFSCFSSSADLLRCDAPANSVTDSRAPRSSLATLSGSIDNASQRSCVQAL